MNPIYKSYFEQNDVFYIKGLEGIAYWIQVITMKVIKRPYLSLQVSLKAAGIMVK